MAVVNKGRTRGALGFLVRSIVFCLSSFPLFSTIRHSSPVLARVQDSSRVDLSIDCLPLSSVSSLLPEPLSSLLRHNGCPPGRGECGYAVCDVPEANPSGTSTLNSQLADKVLLPSFGDIHYFYAPPTSNPPHHRFDKGSYVYLFENANEGRARVEIANQPGTDEQDAFDGGETTDGEGFFFNGTQRVVLTLEVCGQPWTRSMSSTRIDSTAWSA